MTTAGEQPTTADRPAPVPAGKGGRIGKFLFSLIFLAVVGGFIFLARTDRLPKPVDEGYEALKAFVLPTSSRDDEAKPEETPPGMKALWNGLVKVDDDQIAAIRLKTATVRAQTEPIKLVLTGRTAYDEQSLTKIQSRFDALVERVLVERGQPVKKGDPLVNLFSTELATAKNEFQTNYVQWRHDLRLLELREKLVETGAISEQVFVDTQNDESKSRLGYYTSWENLRVLGVSDEEIEPLIAKLGEKASLDGLHNVADKAEMTLRSPVDGIIIERDAVAGNIYDNDDVMFVIAPLNHLWVTINVYERDQAMVAVGQPMEIQFPFLAQTFPGKVEYVASQVSRDTRAIQVRASIPNPDHALKADMLVRAVLDVPALDGQTAIPRIAQVVHNDESYVFVRVDSDEGGDDKTKLFERRRIDVAQENSDTVIVNSGLKAGEVVAAGGSLILAQIFEDLQMVALGAPAE